MITAYAGRLTPQANVLVETKTLILLFWNSFSTIERSFLSKPALWKPNPYGISSFKFLLSVFRNCLSA